MAYENDRNTFERSMRIAREQLARGNYSSVVGTLDGAMAYLEFPEQGWKSEDDWYGSVKDMQKLIAQASEKSSELKGNQSRKLASFKKTIDAELDSQDGGPIVQKLRRDVAKGRNLGTLISSRESPRGHGKAKLFLFFGILGMIVGIFFYHLI
ncbi:hypothetical protein CMI37_08085 [Candidatus Pacearchaeota archaeon]|nr:hypothetical protein [Candidatus Pacearchaeota archaeon]|tara:strand:- start:6550 stop:7008 length:459 start_codon:yes stop_codon:yes gene_type:complete